MSERFSFTVDRSKWWRGKGGEGSQLLRQDGHRCCVGFYLNSLGVPDELLLSANYFPRARSVDEICRVLPDSAKWLQESRDRDRGGVYMVNDLALIDDPERERLLSEMFASRGIDVTFIDGPGERP
jgi:hypothetical protein